MKCKKNRYLKKVKNYEYLKWMFILLIFILITIENQLLQDCHIIIKLLCILTTISINLILVYWTKQGKKFLSFIKASKMELHKIKWPSKQETLRTTLIVLLFTTIISLILWGLDQILFRVITFLISIRLHNV